MPIDEVNITNYRRFRDYRLTGLKQVNLLVGESGAGKSSLLEAVCLLYTGGDFQFIDEICRHRGELGYARLPGPEGQKARPDLRHLFPGHLLDGDMKTSISAGERGSLTIAFESTGTIPSELIGSLAQLQWTASNSLRFRFTGVGASELIAALSGSIAIATARRALDGHASALRARETPRILFLRPTAFLSPVVLDLAWNSLVQRKMERQVASAIRAVNENVEDVILASITGFPTNGAPPLQVGLKGEDRVPIGSLGDAATRLACLAIALEGSRGGTLFVDEIETSMHHTVQEAMWRSVLERVGSDSVETSVFATTHSLECVHALGRVCADRPDWRSMVSIQRIDPNLNHSVPFTDEEVVSISASSIEVR